MMNRDSGTSVEIRRLRADEAQKCALLMTHSEPWITLHRSYDDSLQILCDSSREIYVTIRNDELIGFIILNMTGAFVGYIQTVCIAPELRSKGIGTLLLKFAEERILREAPNVFMCVSSFNKEAQKLYQSLGYEIVGELKDYIVSGYSEILLRKAIAPLAEFKRLSLMNDEVPDSTVTFYYKVDANTELRLLSLDHAQQFFDLAYQNRKHIGEWMFWIGDNYSLYDAQQHIKLALERFAANNGFEAGIWFKGQLAGCVRYNFIDWMHKNTELGYWLGASFQGYGLATKACCALTEYAFTELGLNRVEIRCMSENLKSRRIPETLGFIQEGIVRQVRWRHDHFDDHVIYGMLASEWQKATPGERFDGGPG